MNAKAITNPLHTDNDCRAWLATNDVDTTDIKTVMRLIGYAIDRDWKVSVYDGEAYPVRRSVDRRDIVWAMVSTESDQLIFYNVKGERVGWVSLVYGNEPGVLVSDHTDNPEINALVAEATAHITEDGESQ